MYSLEYSGMLYMLVSYPRQYGLACWPPIVSQNYAKHSLYWGREETSSSPLPCNFLSPKAILFILILSALYRMRICYVLWEYVNMKGSRSTCTRCVGGPGRLPPPPPLSCRSRGGRGGGWRVVSCLGILSREGGIFGLWVRRVTFACGFGMSLRQDILAGLFGGSVWRVTWAHLFNRFESKENMLLSKRNRKEWNVLWWICRLWYHYVVSNIVLFAFIAGSPEPANCGLKTVVMWICESDCEWK